MLDKLKSIIGDTGEVMEHYGGYKIHVKDEINFPWAKIFNFLLDLSFELWIVRDTNLIVMAKQAVD